MGLFTTVVIAFYRSAIVLALTANQPAPFETLLDGLADPEWNLVYIKGTEELFQPYYKSIPEGKKKEDTVLNPNYKYVSLDRLEMYKHLSDPKTFMLEDKLRVSNFLRNTKCQKCKDAIHFGRPEIFDSGFLFERHSPLREVFKNGMVHMRETGAIDNIKHSLAQWLYEGRTWPFCSEGVLKARIHLCIANQA